MGSVVSDVGKAIGSTWDKLTGQSAVNQAQKGVDNASNIQNEGIKDVNSARGLESKMTSPGYAQDTSNQASGIASQDAAGAGQQAQKTVANMSQQSGINAGQAAVLGRKSADETAGNAFLNDKNQQQQNILGTNQNVLGSESNRGTQLTTSGLNNYTNANNTATQAQTNQGNVLGSMAGGAINAISGLLK